MARRDLFVNRVPDVPAGGTVAYVNPAEHDYLPEIELREEGGTPDIIGSIRAGLVFKLKEAVGSELIREREEAFTRRAIASWEKNPNLEKIIQVRYLDAAGKRDDMETPDFQHFAPMVQRVVDGHCGLKS